MKTSSTKFFLIACLVVSSVTLSAQSTFTEVYNILQTNCATSGCHDAATAAGSMDLSGTPQDVYNAIVDVPASNSTASGKRRIAPGYPRQSFLLTKINNGLDFGNELETGMGDPMPKGQPALANHEIEMIRQWVVFGAPENDTVVDPQLVFDFYNGQGKAKLTPPPAPDPAEGFQVLVGPFFMAPHSEIEYAKKEELFNPTDIEVIKLEAEMNVESHHFALYKYFPDRDTLMDPGLREVAGIGDAAAVFFNADIIAEWANSLELELPQGTAFFWEEGAVLDMSYHIINNNDSILAAEVYMNVYFQQPGIAEVEMKALPVYYGGDEIWRLIIPPGDSTFVMEQFDATSNDTIHVWMLTSHTHELGSDYYIWQRNPDGSKGDLVYEGTKSEDYTFDRGFYDWEHPPVRLIEPLLTVPLADGLIHEGTFTNPGTDTTYFGLTTEDEMFVTYMLYTEELPSKTTSITPLEYTKGQVRVYPNPFGSTTQFVIDAELNAPVDLTITNLIGREVDQVLNITDKTFVYDREGLPNGIYLFELRQEGVQIGSGKLVVQ